MRDPVRYWLYCSMRDTIGLPHTGNDYGWDGITHILVGQEDRIRICTMAGRHGSLLLVVRNITRRTHKTRYDIPCRASFDRISFPRLTAERKREYPRMCNTPHSFLYHNHLTCQHLPGRLERSIIKIPAGGVTETMNTPNGAVFHRAYAQDDRGLENEVMAILIASAVRFNSHGCTNLFTAWKTIVSRERSLLQQPYGLQDCIGSLDICKWGKGVCRLARFQWENWYTGSRAGYWEWPENPRSGWRAWYIRSPRCADEAFLPGMEGLNWIAFIKLPNCGRHIKRK